MLRKIALTLLFFFALHVFVRSVDAGVVTINSTDRGWIASNGRANTTPVGWNNYAVGSNATGSFNNFAVFDLSALSGTVASARLELYNPLRGWSAVNGDAPQTYQVFSVTTSPTLLIFESPDPTLFFPNSPAGIAIHNDLGSGTLLGERTIMRTEVGKFIDIQLNADALSAINAGVGGFFAIGGKLSGSEPAAGRAVFGNSGIVSSTPGIEVFTPSNVRLVVNTVPEPSTVIMLVIGLATGALVGSRQRRKEPMFRNEATNV